MDSGGSLGSKEYSIFKERGRVRNGPAFFVQETELNADIKNVSAVLPLRAHVLLLMGRRSSSPARLSPEGRFMKPIILAKADFKYHLNFLCFLAFSAYMLAMLVLFQIPE